VRATERGGQDVTLGGRAVGLAEGLCEGPVNDEGLAVVADQNVARPEVAMDHAAAVGIGDRVADIEEAGEQPAGLGRAAGAGGREFVIGTDGLLQVVAADEAHGIERAARGVVAEAVDGDDAGVLELAGDLRLARGRRPGRRGR
jgi:hypothetical protein